MKNIEIQIEKTRNKRNILLPDWTQDDNPQEVEGVPTLFQKSEQNTEQDQNTAENREILPQNDSFLLQSATPAVPDWVKIVEKWTPEMTVMAWPKINQVIDQYGEESAAAWVCEQSIKFFGKHLTSNDILRNIYLTSDQT